MATLPITSERLNEVFNSDPRSDTDIGIFFGVSKQTISAWKNGVRSPKKSKLKEIADYYQKDIMWFFGFDTTEKSLPISVEEDEQIKEIINLLHDLSEKKKMEALRYIRYLSSSEEDE